MNRGFSIRYAALYRALVLCLITVLCLTMIVPAVSMLPANAASLITSITIKPGELIMPVDFSLSAVMSISCTPTDADAHKVAWESDNPLVATVNASGDVKPVGIGSTLIRARATDGSGVVSGDCAVTITPSEGINSTDQQLNLPDSASSRININTYLGWPQNYGDVQVALWPDNKIAVVSFTVDDGLYDDFPVWNEWQDRFGFVTTFIAPTDIDHPLRDFKVDKWQPMIDRGQDVQSHTRFHRSNLPVAEDANTALVLTSAQWIDEFNGSKAKINSLLSGADCKVIGYSYAYGDLDYARQFYIGGRMGVGILNNPDKINYMNTNSISMTPFLALYGFKPNANSAVLEGAFGTLIDESRTYTYWNSSYYAGWLSFHSHGLESNIVTHPELGPNTSVRKIMEIMLNDFIAPNRDKLHVDSYTNISMYGQERDTAEWNVTDRQADRIEFTLTDKMHDKYFTYPLTVKMKLDSTWDRVSATQNGSPVEAKLVKDGSSYYALIKAVPDKGNVVVTKTGTPKVYSNNTKLASLTYTAENGAELPVTGFDTSHNGVRSYTVMLEAGTKYANVYAEKADASAKIERSLSMGRVDTTSGGGSLTVSVTAEDGSVSTYTVNFTVRSYDAITALAISHTGSLIQPVAPEKVSFSVSPTPAEGIDVNSIEWYVNDVKAPGAKGAHFEYTPARTGSYEIYAKSGSAQSQSRTIELTAATAVPDISLIKEDFNSYGVGTAVPIGASTKWNGNFPSGSVIVADDPTLGNVGSALGNGGNITLSTKIDMQEKPIVISGKVRIDAPLGDPRHSISFQLRSNTYTNPFGFGHNGQSTLGGSWGAPSETPGQWASFAAYVAPDLEDITQTTTTAFVGGYLNNKADQYVKRTATIGMAANMTLEDMHFNVIMTFPAGTDKMMYIDDINVYIPNSFTMETSKTDVIYADSPVRINFNHHADLTTLTKDNVSVKTGDTPVEIASITVDKMNFDHFIINFAPGALKDGTTYTVSLDESVLDITGAPVFGTASFNTAGEDVIETLPDSGVTITNVSKASDALKFTFSADITLANSDALGVFIVKYAGGTLAAIDADTADSAGINSISLSVPAASAGEEIYLFAWNQADLSPVIKKVKLL